jgi:hypothetical protein
MVNWGHSRSSTAMKQMHLGLIRVKWICPSEIEEPKCCLSENPLFIFFATEGIKMLVKVTKSIPIPLNMAARWVVAAPHHT